MDKQNNVEGNNFPQTGLEGQHVDTGESVEYLPLAGEQPIRTAVIMVRLATENNKLVTAKHNTILMTANPGDSEEDILSRYDSEWNIQHPPKKP